MVQKAVAGDRVAAAGHHYPPRHDPKERRGLVIWRRHRLPQRARFWSRNLSWRIAWQILARGSGKHRDSDERSIRKPRWPLLEGATPRNTAGAEGITVGGSGKSPATQAVDVAE